MVSNPMFRPSAEETVLVAQILAHCDTYPRPRKRDRDTISSKSASGIFAGAGLDSEILQSIFRLVDEEETGFFSRDDLGVLVRLIGWAQDGVQVKRSLIERTGPLPVIIGLPVLWPKRRQCRNPSGYSMSTFTFELDAYPPLTFRRSSKYIRIFDKVKTAKGILSGHKVWKTFTLSKLPSDTLSAVWDLLDTCGRGDLNLTEFIVAMYFIDGILDKTLIGLPSKVPEALFNQAEESILVVGSSRGVAQNTRGRRRPDVSKALPDIIPPNQRWAVTIAVQINAALSFSALGPESESYVEEAVFMAHMADFDLPEEDLRKIWHLANIGDSGRMSKDEFAVAQFLIHRTLAGVRIPRVLPKMMIPPHLRAADDENVGEKDNQSTEVPWLDTEQQYAIPAAVKSKAECSFSIMDYEGKGYIESDVVMSFIMEYNVPSGDIERIWDLADPKGKGRLKREQFTILLFLIHRILGGLELSDQLPESMILGSPSPENMHKLILDNERLQSSLPDEPVTAVLRAMLPPLPQEMIVETQNNLPSVPAENSRPLPRPARPRRPPPPLPIPVPSPEPVSSNSDPFNDIVQGTSLNVNEIETQLGELRGMIASLAMENDSLRRSVFSLSQTRLGGAEEEREIDSDDEVDNSVPPPAYQELHQSA